MAIATATTTLDDLFGAIPSCREVREYVARGQAVCAEGVSGGGKAAFCASLLADPTASALLLTFNDERAGQLVSDLQTLLDAETPEGERRVILYPSIASALYDGITPEPEAVAQPRA